MFIYFVAGKNKSLWVEALVVVAAVWTWAVVLVKQHLTIIDLVSKTVRATRHLLLLLLFLFSSRLLTRSLEDNSQTIVDYLTRIWQADGAQH